jgi:hypothetical protein
MLMQLLPVLIVLGMSVPAAAAQQAPAAQAESPKVDVDKLPIDLKRVERKLKDAPSIKEERDGLNLRYTLQIYGVAPRLQFFSEDDNLTTGPVPWGAPTHQEMINHITPQEYRAPYADFSALIRWLADRKKKP